MTQEVKAPAMLGDAPNEEWKRIHLYNQERMLSSQEDISEGLKGLLETQRKMVEFATRLSANMDVLDETLRESSAVMKGFVSSVIKIPIVICITGMASWGFYNGKVSEHSWLAILAVASFPYFGEGITAIANIFGLGRKDGGVVK